MLIMLITNSMNRANAVYTF